MRLRNKKMISPLLLASVLGTFSNAQYATFEDFYNDFR